jgi:hypothetical protein
MIRIWNLKLYIKLILNKNYNYYNIIILYVIFEKYIMAKEKRQN